ncbi:hypothetical protein QYE76_054779 [Lolium multiflorum]|uniref:Uncharacterized protein n=1 Tax=Lolium multiflorum TaxID=4521 RepID=A0AAD8SZC8_LOLMU|nr:hypothetical protein QYE76_054779 [Lolium multiflorum]
MVHGRRKEKKGRRGEGRGRRGGRNSQPEAGRPAKRRRPVAGPHRAHLDKASSGSPDGDRDISGWPVGPRPDPPAPGSERETQTGPEPGQPGCRPDRPAEPVNRRPGANRAEPVNGRGQTSRRRGRSGPHRRRHTATTTADHRHSSPSPASTATLHPTGKHRRGPTATTASARASTPPTTGIPPPPPPSYFDPFLPLTCVCLFRFECLVCDTNPQARDDILGTPDLQTSCRANMDSEEEDTEEYTEHFEEDASSSTADVEEHVELYTDYGTSIANMTDIEELYTGSESIANMDDIDELYIDTCSTSMDDMVEHHHEDDIDPIMYTADAPTYPYLANGATYEDRGPPRWHHHVVSSRASPTYSASTHFSELHKAPS